MRTRTRLAAAGLTLMAAAAPLAGVAQAKAITGPSARIRTDSGTTYASINRTVGATEYASGITVDKVFGQSAITYALKLLPAGNGTFSVKSPKVVLYTSRGAISGTATATVAVVNGQQTITNGKLNLTKGTAGLKGYQFSGTFTGTADLTKNLLVFNYKGKLTS